MKLGMNSIATLVAAGVISSAANANPVQLSAELSKLDQKAASSIQVILSNSAISESQKVAQIEVVMKKVNFAKEFQKMRLKVSDESVQKIGQGLTCGDYNL